MSLYLKRIYHDRSAKVEPALAWDGQNADVLWYLRVLEDTHRPVTTVAEKALKPGDRVMAYQKHVKEYIDTHYKSHIVETSDAVSVYQIDSLK